ncbi:hypothetical protein AAKU55_003141 [Oxalobacteraceae bacterium GrIS 1.11]
MFIIKSDKDKTISWPVSVETAADGGKIQKFEFTGTFRLLGDDEKEAMAAETKAESVEAVAGEGENQWKESSIDNIMKIMTGWKGVVDEDKAPIDFTRDNVRAAVRSAQGVSILRAINTAIHEITFGARSKN